MDEKTGAFQRTPCPDCSGTGELRFDSENINENFEVEQQTLIVQCPRCMGLGADLGQTPAASG